MPIKPSLLSRLSLCHRPGPVTAVTMMTVSSRGGAFARIRCWGAGH
jgi:hypothetical protein